MKWKQSDETSYKNSKQVSNLHSTLTVNNLYCATCGSRTRSRNVRDGTSTNGNTNFPALPVKNMAGSRFC